MDEQAIAAGAPPPRLGIVRVLRTAGRTLALAWAASPAGFAAVLGLTLLASALPPVALSLSRRVVDLIVHSPVALRSLLPSVVAVAAITAGQRLLAVLQSNRQQVFAAEVARHAERLFLEKASGADLARFDEPAWHDRVQRVSQDVTSRPFALTIQSIGLVGSAATLLGLLGVLFSLDPLLLVLVLLAVVVPLPFQRRVNREIWRHYYQETTKQREQWYYRYLLSDPSAAKDLRAYVLEGHILDRHERLSRERQRELRRLFATADWMYGLGALLGAGGLSAAFVFVAYRAAAGALSAGDVTALFGALSGVTMLISGFFNSFGLIDQHAPFLANFFDFLAVPPLIPRAEAPLPLPEGLHGGIELDDVVFRYPGRDRPAVDHLSLHIRDGEMVALVGDNGAGKTTLLKLLLRFYDPHQGAVRVGGLDLRQLDPLALRQRIGVLFQDYTSFTLRARDAVALGRVTTPSSDEPIWAALEAARAGDIVRKLPRGLDSFVGRFFEEGKDLSGGEWQRLALARLMFRNADIWVLDEPTSALDPGAEAEIFAELKHQLRGRIGIVISHRFSTVRMADRIAVVEGGRIAELGSHAELMALGGRYARLFELQAAAYR